MTRLSFKPGDDVRAIWIAAAAVLAAGYYFVQAPFERQIRAQSAATASLSAAIDQNDSAISQMRSLRQVEIAALKDLAHVSLDPRLSFVSASFLSDISAAAKPRFIKILSVEAQPPVKRLPGASISGTALTLRIEGRFAQILTFLEAVTQERILCSVDSVELGLANAKGKRLIDAELHATLYRVFPPDMHA